VEKGEREVSNRAESRMISEPLPRRADPAERSWRGFRACFASIRTHLACSFSRAERTRPLRPVSRLLCCYFENIPVECFQHIFPLFKSTINQKGHSHLCPFFLCYCCVKSSDTARRVPANVCRAPRRLFTLPVPALRLPALRCKRTLPLPFAAPPLWGMWGRYGCSHPPDRHRRGRMRQHR